MGLGDLFRARHKHSDREVRLEAVRQLGADDRELLVDIARSEADAEIQRLAIERIDDVDALIELGAGGVAAAKARASELLGRDAIGSDEAAATAAIAAIAELGDAGVLARVAQRSPIGAVRRRAVEQIEDAGALAEIARGAGDEQVCREAIERIADVDVLRGIALDETRKSLGLAAVDRIEDAAVLEQVAARAKHKAVRARARKHITGEDEVAGVEVEPERLAHAERVQLTRTVERLAGTEDYLRAAEVEESARRFAELGAGDDVELAARFEKAVARFRDGAAAQVKRTLPGPKQVVEVPPEVRGKRKARPPTKTEVPAEEPKPAVPAAKRELPEILAELEVLARDLEAVAASDRIKTLNRALSRCDKRLAALGELPKAAAEHAKRVADARQALVIRAGVVKEQIEWQQWANVPKQEELIARASALAADLEAGKLADKLKKLQADWKAVGPVPRDKAQPLWDAFKEACDVIYARVKEERESDNQQRRDNLAKKVELCEQAEALADSEDWEATAAALKSLQAQWKAVGPAPRRQADKIWKRFRAACDRFFARRQPHLDEQLAESREAIERKTAVVEQIEALVGAEADVNERLVTLDDLRRQFARAGRVPPREFGKLRGRIDAAEKKLTRERAAAREAADQARAAREAELVAAVEALAGGESVSTESIGEVRAALRDAGDSEAIAAARARFEAVVAAAIEADPGAFAGTDLDPVASRDRREKLIARLEELVPESEAPPQTAEEMAARLRAALADRALGGILSKEADPRTIRKVLGEVESAWARTGPVPGAEGQSLEQRYQSARTRARSKLK